MSHPGAAAAAAKAEAVEVVEVEAVEVSTVGSDEVAKPAPHPDAGKGKIPKTSPEDAEFFDPSISLPPATAAFLERLDHWDSLQLHRCKVPSLWDYTGIFFKILKQLIKAFAKYFWSVPVAGQVANVVSKLWPIIRPLLNIPIIIIKMITGHELVKMPVYVVNGVLPDGTIDQTNMLIGKEQSCGLFVGNTPLQDSRSSSVEFRPLLAGWAPKRDKDDEPDAEDVAQTAMTFSVEHKFQCCHAVLGACKKVPECKLALPNGGLELQSRLPNSKHEDKKQKVWWVITANGEDRVRVTHPLCPRICSAQPRMQMVRDIKDENRQDNNVRIFDFYGEGSCACPGAGDGRGDKKILLQLKEPGENGPVLWDPQVVEMLSKVKKTQSLETVSFKGMSRMEKLACFLSLMHAEYVEEECPINDEI